MSASIRASWGSTIVAAFVPTTVTVCWPSASMISPARRSPTRGARFFSRFPILRRPAWRKASGVGQARSRSNTAGWSRRGPRTRSRAGVDLGLQASDPVRCCVACFAKSSSKPRSPPVRPACSSATWLERSVCGIVRAASAITYASRASVFASPGCRSAIRRIASPGRYPTSTRAAGQPRWAVHRSRRAGHTTSTARGRFARRTVPRSRLVLGPGPVVELPPVRVHRDAWCSPLPTSRPTKTSNALWFPITCTSPSQELIPVLDCPRCQSPHPRYARRSQTVLPLLEVSPAPTGPR